jgi:hypothetical protein
LFSVAPAGMASVEVSTEVQARFIFAGILTRDKTR